MPRTISDSSILSNCYGHRKASERFVTPKVDKIRLSGGTGRQQIYRVHFISREAIRNSVTRISKAFSGPVENAVWEIVQNEKYLDTVKPIYLEPTATNSKYVITNLKPFQQIKFAVCNIRNYRTCNSNYRRITCQQ